MADKPAKEGDPGFDVSKLITDDEPPADEGKDEQDGQDDHGADDELSLDELDAQLRKALEEGGDEDGDDDDGEEEPAADDVAGRLAKTEAELKALKKERRQKIELEERKAAGREILAAVKELKLTREQLNRTVKYFQKRPDLEGVVPFREAALLVNPSLSGDRVSSRESNGRSDGPSRGENAQVITHRGGGPAPRREAFKPSPDPGNYSNVTAAILASGNARKLIVAE